MEKMIDNNILMGRLETALRMEWVKTIYENENNDFDTAFDRLMKLHKGANYEPLVS